MAFVITASTSTVPLAVDGEAPQSDGQPDRENPWRCDLGTQINDALRNVGKVALRRIDIRTEAAHVTLRGRVRSYYLKQLAQHVAASVAGVDSVNNQLVVEGADP